jgi:hypothetical protein
VYHITPELQQLHDSGNIHSALNKMNTDELKYLCEMNGILRGGPKYGLVNRLKEHAALGVKKTTQASLAEKVSAGVDAGSAVELKFMGFKSFDAAYKCAQREVAGTMAKAKTTKAKFQILKVRRGCMCAYVSVFVSMCVSLCALCVRLCAACLMV